jgi:GNAT superfamily N-acetyltransferase
MTVRIATRADEGEIMLLLHLMHGECGMLSLDEDCARETFNLSFDRKGGIIGVIGEPKNIKAMICLLITRFWYTKENHLEELFNYVRPDARESDHAKTLIAFAKECAEKIGIPLVIGVLTNKQMAPKVRLYRRILGTPAGAFFVHNRPARWAGDDYANEDFWRATFAARKEKSLPLPIAIHTAAMAGMM